MRPRSDPLPPAPSAGTDRSTVLPTRHPEDPMPLPSDEFVMPRPYTLVLWRHSRDAEPSPALVTGVFRRTISCTVFPLDSQRGMPKDGVRHLTDPVSATISPDEGGLWDYTPDQILLRDLCGENYVQHPKK